MDRQLTVKSLPALILCILRHAFVRFASCVLRHALIQKNSRHEPHGQSNSSMATRTETTHGLAYLVVRAIDIGLALDSPALCDTVCLCCLTHGVWTPTSPHNSADGDG